MHFRGASKSSLFLMTEFGNWSLDAGINRHNIKSFRFTRFPNLQPAMLERSNTTLSFGSFRQRVDNAYLHIKTFRQATSKSTRDLGGGLADPASKINICTLEQAETQNQ